MTERDKQWNMRCEQLVEFKRTNGHCLVPFDHEQDKPLGWWVSKQRNDHTKNKLRLDRKGTLDKIGFTWKDGSGGFKPDDKSWHQQCEKLVQFKRTNGHCMVPRNKEQSRQSGLQSSGTIIRMTSFDSIVRQLWTKSGSLGTMMNRKANGTCSSL
jgi:hypothetical protein